MHSYEVEIKSLLGSKERADQVRSAMQKADPASTLTSRNKQLNHYFADGRLDSLEQTVSPKISNEAQIRFHDIAQKAKEFSVRTREKDGAVLLVVKASVGDDTSANGISRIEFEEKIPVSLETLDKMILGSGFKYHPKHSPPP